MLFAAYDVRHSGWCVFEQVQPGIVAELYAGPFQTREHAERLLGPQAPEALTVTQTRITNQACADKPLDGRSPRRLRGQVAQDPL